MYARVNLATRRRSGIAGARRRVMATDFLTLLQRDHHDLDHGLAELLAPWATVADIRSALDGVRLGLTAHAEAEDIVLAIAFDSRANQKLDVLLHGARGGHLDQESLLGALVCARPGTASWRQRAGELRRAVAEHAAWEEHCVVPALRAAAPDTYAKLAGAFATERLRQLAMLEPSGPVFAVAS
jgi:hypothetical protein